MEEYVFKKSRSFNITLKLLYSHLCRDIAPAVFGAVLLHVAYFENYENFRPDVAIWYLIAGSLVIVYALFRFWKLYKKFSSARIKSFSLDEKGVHIDFTKYPFKVEAHWKDIERIEYFPGGEDGWLIPTVEYLEYTDIIGRFKEPRGTEFNTVIRIMNCDWKTEQDKDLFDVLHNLEGSKEKFKLI